jgi:Icc-related predicted phosphoesterase
MTPCFFVADLHGHHDRYEKLFAAVRRERPAAVFLGGDLLPSAFTHRPDVGRTGSEFVSGYLGQALAALREDLGDAYPRLFVILGNDDPQVEEEDVLDLERQDLCTYLHGRRARFDAWTVYGYACVPPTPFRLKDWEVYDVSRYVDPGCVAPEDGWRTVGADPRELARRTIERDLKALAGDEDQSAAVWLFHAPPYQTALDRAALDGVAVDYVPLDVHVGSVAIRRFIEERQPALTLHGHIHESARITGAWRERIDRTMMLSAAHDGSELALVRFDPARPDAATRELI